MNIRHYVCVYVRKILRSYYYIRIIIDIIINTKKCSIIFYDYDDDRCVASGNQVSDIGSTRRLCYVPRAETIEHSAAWCPEIFNSSCF